MWPCFLKCVHIAFVCPLGGKCLPNTSFMEQLQSHHIVIPPKGFRLAAIKTPP